jgi:hypothetical protein
VWWDYLIQLVLYIVLAAFALVGTVLVIATASVFFAIGLLLRFNWGDAARLRRPTS